MMDAACETSAGRLTRPAHVCSALLMALDASDGRRKSRKRDQTPDAIGLTLKRRLLEQVVADDPDGDAFEEWLVCYVEAHEGTAFPGAISAIARMALEEWRLAHAMRDFAAWLERGAPSEDALLGVSERDNKV